ncbi:hypothetical protein PT974_01691 [Cladobotryum mycophilum]|uniref:Nudix hydrolase domain-containing protein n=1 Tax=Cladobotryum mycophilum TaxID=491253 RepID=A0ABR0SW09_9HYPO
MAASKFTAAHYTSEQFVESCGAILFDLSHPILKVCILHYIKKDQWLLAKGRRNCNESRCEAALREMHEETGYKCHLSRVTMPTRAPGPDEACNVSDRARIYSGLSEPFMLSIREMDGKSNVKLIWWYIAEIDWQTPKVNGEPEFTAALFDSDEALRRLTFQGDRDVLIRAISILENSCQQESRN